ncbi:MAG: HIT family protein [Acidobacteriota bacterium]|nr:HIT family protein [Acidobacteriota bacterium]
MADILCATCGLAAERVIVKTDAGSVAVPAGSVRPGHVMVVSAAHAASLSELSEPAAAAFMLLLGAAMRAAERATGQAHCYALRIGDRFPHLHWHLVPRVEGDPALAPFVFGDAGWSAGAHASGPLAADAFDAAFAKALRVPGSP